jgi:MFS transporter, FHS family, L-fucose permease
MIDLHGLQSIATAYNTGSGEIKMNTSEPTQRPQEVTSQSSLGPQASIKLLTALTCVMFLMFAMTTDAVGEIIKLAKGDMGLSNTQASTFHWATMVAIALSGLFLGSLADRLGRKRAIIAGLLVYGTASALFMSGKSFELYVVLLFVSGLAIGLFKTAALALIGDIAESTKDHTSKMNAVEGFFAIGAIIGPMLVVYFSKQGIHWTALYGFAAALCAIMVLAASRTRFPEKVVAPAEKPASLLQSLALIRNKYVLGFSLAIALYVACEVAIFVWLPTFLSDFVGGQISTLFAAYAVMIFFILRAAGRFTGIWMLERFRWEAVLAVFSGCIFLCFLLSVTLGKSAAVILLPLSGLFMSIIYPTINSKGISCSPKAEHGAAAGLILFFTALSAALSPLAMAWAADTFAGGDLKLGFGLATVFAGLLFVLCAWNLIVQPAKSALLEADVSQYA